MSPHDPLNSPLKKARSLGSAHEGAHHWLMERVTSLVLVPLVAWFVITLISITGAEHFEVIEFFKSPLNALLMALLVIISFYHTALGLTVVVEDYVHVKAAKIISLLVINFGLLSLGIVTVLAIAKMHFAL